MNEEQKRLARFAVAMLIVNLRDTDNRISFGQFHEMMTLAGLDDKDWPFGPGTKAKLEAILEVLK